MGRIIPITNMTWALDSGVREVSEFIFLGVWSAISFKMIKMRVSRKLIDEVWVRNKSYKNFHVLYTSAPQYLV